MSPETLQAYESAAHTYHRRRRSRSRAWEYVYANELAHALPEGGRVLALGSGTGEELETLRAYGFRPTGFDRSRAMLDIARDNAQGPLCQGDVRALPFTDGSFDAVFSVAAFAHLPRSGMPGAFAEAARVLRPGGAFLLVTRQGQGEARVEKDGLPPRLFTFVTDRELVGMAERAGLDVDLLRVDGAEDAWIVLLATKPGRLAS